MDTRRKSLLEAMVRVTAWGLHSRFSRHASTQRAGGNSDSTAGRSRS